MNPIHRQDRPTTIGNTWDQKVQYTAEHVLLQASQQHIWHRQGLVPCTDKSKYRCKLLKEVQSDLLLPITASNTYFPSGTISQHLLTRHLTWYPAWALQPPIPNIRPRGYKTWLHSQTPNKAHRLAACGHMSASSQSLRFILSIRLYSSFITSRLGLGSKVAQL